MVGDMFNKLSGGQVTNVLRARNMVLVTFVSQEGAMLAMVAMEKSRGIELEGSKLEVNWWSQRRLDRGSYSSQPRSQVHHTRLNQEMAYQGQYMQDYLKDREMARLAQRNMMASQLSQPPPGYSLAQALSGLRLASQPTQWPSASPSKSAPVPRTPADSSVPSP